MLEGIKSWFRRLRYTMKKDVFNLTNITIFAALILCAFWSWSAIDSMSRNWELEEKLKTRKLEQAKLEIEVETLKLEQEYYQTDEYKELIARIKSGKKAHGETMVILPKNSEFATQKYNQPATEKSSIRNNFSKWLDFLLG